MGPLSNTMLPRSSPCFCTDLALYNNRAKSRAGAIAFSVQSISPVEALVARPGLQLNILYGQTIISLYNVDTGILSEPTRTGIIL